MDNCWIYEGKCLEIPPEGYYGFIYCITDITGKQYWGRKAFEHKTKKTISKKARVASGSKKRIERGTKDSGWQEYYGSCKPLLTHIEEIGTEGVTREIIKLCKDKQSLAYWEMVTQINNVLFTDCWNSNVGGKFFKGKIHE